MQNSLIWRADCVAFWAISTNSIDIQFLAHSSLSIPSHPRGSPLVKRTKLSVLLQPFLADPGIHNCQSALPPCWVTNLSHSPSSLLLNCVFSCFILPVPHSTPCPLCLHSLAPVSSLRKCTPLFILDENRTLWGRHIFPKKFHTLPWRWIIVPNKSANPSSHLLVGYVFPLIPTSRLFKSALRSSKAEHPARQC